MEYANDEVFKIRYNTHLNRLQVKKEMWTSKLAKLIMRHKLIAMTVLAFLIFSSINLIMILNFLKILQNL